MFQLKTICFFLGLAGLCAPLFATSFIETHPGLKDYRFKEPTSNFYFSIGLSPLGLTSNGAIFGASLFQVHYRTKTFDIEMISGTLGFGTGTNSLSSSRKVILRSVPKIRLGSVFSFGPLAGVEFVNYPQVFTKLYYGSQITQTYEPFSTSGLIYGLGFSQTIHLTEEVILRINELLYREDYSTSTAANNWSYYFQDPGLQADVSPIKAGNVAALEFCLMF